MASEDTEKIGSLNRFWTVLMWLFVRVTGWLPLAVSWPIGKWLGRIAFVVMRDRRGIALANLDRAYGDTLSAAEKRRIARGAFENFGIVAMEFPHTPKAGASPIVRIEGRENLDPVAGGLFASGHNANWEWMAPTFAAHGLPVAEVVNSYADPKRGELFDEVRRASGVITVAKDAAASTITKLLSDKVFVGILVDQSVRKNAAPTTFYGQPCWTTTGPAVLAIRSGVPMHLAVMRREADGSYVLRVSPKIAYKRTRDFRADVAALSQMLQDQLEEHVRAYPEQWMWMHNRWKPRRDKRERWARLKKPAVSEETASAPPEAETAE